MGIAVEPEIATPKRGRPRDAEQTRKRILDAATVEFARKGLGGARVDAIALRSKSNKRMIYHYFGSKEQLFKAVIELPMSVSAPPSKNCISMNSTPKKQLPRWCASPGTITSNIRNS